MSRFRQALTLSALAVMAIHSPVSAQDAEESQRDSLRVTGRTPGDRQLQMLQTPSLGIGLGRDQIDAVNRVNVEDSFKYAPDLIVRKRYIGDPNATLSMRGGHTTQTPRTLVSVDGFIISNFLGASFDTAPKWAVLAPGDLGGVEIVYGPTAARYSGNSMDGVLRLETRAIDQSTAYTDLQTFVQDYDYYDSHETLWGWSVDTGIDAVLSERAALAVSYRHFENTGQPMQWRTVAPDTPYADQAIVDTGLGFPLRIAAADSAPETRQDQFRLRGTYDFGGGWTGRTLLALISAREDETDPQSFLHDERGQQIFIGIDGVTYSRHDKTELLAGIGLAGEAAGWRLDAVLSHFNSLKDETRQSDPFDPVTGLPPATGLRTDGDGAAWTNADVSGTKTIGAQELSLGLSYADYRFDTRTDNTSDWLRGATTGRRAASGGRTRLLGAFIEDAITLAPQWTATLGLRAERWTASRGYLDDGTARTDYADRSRHAISPKGALSFTPGEDWKFTASAALATRFPTVRELYQASLISYGADLGQLDLNGFNPDLAPERGFDLQLTARRQFSQATLTVNAFRQSVRDTIFSQTLLVPANGDPDRLVEQSLNTNIGRVVTRGIDVILATHDLPVDGLALDANLTLLDATVVKNPLNPALEGNHFPRVPDMRANASLRYSPDEDWTFAAGWRYQDTPYRNIENSANARCGTYFCVTDFSFVDLKVTRRVGTVALSLGVDNLFDDKAFVFHPYPGRTMLLQMRWTGEL